MLRGVAMKPSHASRRTPFHGMRVLDWSLRTWTAGVFVFLYLPILVLVV